MTEIQKGLGADAGGDAQKSGASSRPRLVGAPGSFFAKAGARRVVRGQFAGPVRQPCRLACVPGTLSKRPTRDCVVKLPGPPRGDIRIDSQFPLKASGAIESRDTARGYALKRIAGDLSTVNYIAERCTSCPEKMPRGR